jgi:hypothetical protein
MRKWLIKIFAVLLILVLAVGLLEGLCTAWAWWKYKTVDVAEIERIQSGNGASATDDADNRIVRFYPHPWLSYVRNSATEPEPTMICRRVNNIGTSGRDWPLKKNPEKFTLLLVGSSVARDVALAGEGNRPYIETYLNERYQFDKPVEVLCGGNSNWNIFQAETLYAMYGEIGDAVVTITGFNEHYYQTGGPRRLEYPNANFFKLNPIASRGFEPIAAGAMAQQLRDFALDSGWRSTYFFTWAMRRKLEATANREITQGNSIDTLFALPKEWSKSQRNEFNVRLCEKYLRQFDALVKLNGVPSAHVIQPVPAVGKVLTEDEKRLVGVVDYGDQYNYYAEQMLATGLPMIDLRDIFNDRSETIYCDNVHCLWETPAPGDQYRPSPGYRLMADRIADELAKLWKIPRKSEAKQ